MPQEIAPMISHACQQANAGKTECVMLIFVVAKIFSSYPKQLLFANSKNLLVMVISVPAPPAMRCIINIRYDF